MLDENIIARLKELRALLPVDLIERGMNMTIDNAIEELEWRQNSVVQLWVQRLTRMQQSVLFAAIRGPDGISKNHISKKLIRFLRRCVLKAAFDNLVYPVPYDPKEANWKSGSFTGPSCYRGPFGFHAFNPDDRRAGTALQDLLDQTQAHPDWQSAMQEVITLYLETVDELPHHFQLHFMHAAEIIGYKHPWPSHRAWWHHTYCRLVNDAHLVIESERNMDIRLGDSERQWRDAEEVTAHV